jgi:hypothetical protein
MTPIQGTRPQVEAVAAIRDRDAGLLKIQMQDYFKIYL